MKILLEYVNRQLLILYLSTSLVMWVGSGMERSTMWVISASKLISCVEKQSSVSKLTYTTSNHKASDVRYYLSVHMSIVCRGLSLAL